MALRLGSRDVGSRNPHHRAVASVAAARSIVEVLVVSLSLIEISWQVPVYCDAGNDGIG